MGTDEGLSPERPPAGGFLPPVAEPPPAAQPPGPPAPRLVLAPWIARAGALLVDTLVLTPLFVVGLLATGGADDEGSLSDAVTFSTTAEGLVLSVAMAAAFALYTTVSLVLWRGKTLGKHAVGIRVVREDGAAPDWRTALVRQVPIQAVAGSLLPLVGLADYLWPLGDRQNRALHDLLAKTRVVRS